MNLKIRKLEDDIIALLNESDVPIEGKRLILDSVMRLVKDEADRQILEEMQNAESIYKDNMGGSSVNEHGA